MKRLMYTIFCLAALMACSKEQGLVQVTEQTNGSETVLATAKDFVTVRTTKTVITQSDSNAPAFAWKAEDVIGIIPMNNETVQSNYKVAEIDSNPKNATFDGGVWKLKEGEEYAAYYPFKKEALVSNESIKFSFLGQTQSANNSLEHLGAYDYMYADAIMPQYGSAHFDFEHKISLVRLQLKVSKADTFTKVVLESSASWFANEASLKLSDGMMTATETVKSATINLNDIEVSANGILTVWFAVLPTNALSSQILNVKLFGNENTFTGEITCSTALKAGSAYSYASTLVLEGQQVEYVDLGLPSGLKWATCNIGANAPEEFGGYYQWGGLQDVSSTSIYLDYNNCPYHTGSDPYNGWTKYIPSSKSSYWSGIGSPDNKTVLDPSDDVAHVKLGGKWRMPTRTEFTELCNNCTLVYTTLNGVEGIKFTSDKNGNSIFLPAAGLRIYDESDRRGSGDYLSSSLNTSNPHFAYGLFFYSDGMPRVNYYYARFIGRTVRPVYGDKVSVNGVSINKTNLSLYVLETFTLSATVSPFNAAETSIHWSSNNTSVATVDQSGNVTAVKAGSATITVKTTDGGYVATCNITVISYIPEAVDLGLPSGIKWASFNLGASKPEEYGGYYQWGGLQNVINTNIYLGWSNCPYHTGSDSYNGWTKYIPSSKSSYWSGTGSPDNKTVLDPEDDVAHVMFGGKWRMPTKEDFRELIDNCTYEWTTLNGVEGKKFISEKNGNSIFLPAAGLRHDNDIYDVGSACFYWFSSLNTASPNYAGEFFFYFLYTITGSEQRFYGLSVRPVSE